MDLPQTYEDLSINQQYNITLDTISFNFRQGFVLGSRQTIDPPEGRLDTNIQCNNKSGSQITIPVPQVSHSLRLNDTA